MSSEERYDKCIDFDLTLGMAFINTKAFVTLQNVVA